MKLDNIRIVRNDEEIDVGSDTKMQWENARVGKPIAFFY